MAGSPSARGPVSRAASDVAAGGGARGALRLPARTCDAQVVPAGPEHARHLLVHGGQVALGGGAREESVHEALLDHNVVAAVLDLLHQAHVGGEDCAGPHA